jgi:hypothetical protein
MSDDETDLNAILEPGRVRGWVEGNVPEGPETTSAPERPSLSLPVRLMADGTLRLDKLRVFPRPRGIGIEWFDAAGYLVANGRPFSLPEGWSETDVDFVLDPQQHSVRVSPYL